MKTKVNQGLVCGLAVMALSALNFQLSTASAAVTCALTPSAVSNTYAGPITMTIAGLSSGGSVVVQKYLDLNGNGAIDGSDLLVQQFSMTDGQPGMVIGGVTNFNVPGDTDGAANGQITAKWNFQGGDFSQNIVGKYLFKVSGNFSPPVTAVFTVTNFPFAQKFTGTVFSNNTSVAVANAIVLLFPPGMNGGPQAGVVANNAGAYTVLAPPGTYMLGAMKSNFVGNFGAAPVLTLGSGATVPANLSLTNATARISGKVVDANNSSLGLPGIIFPVQTQNGLLGVCFTDTNGNFSVGVLPGQWKVKADDTALIVHGYLGLQNGIYTNAGATGVTIAVPKATALVYGSVKDNLGNPIPGVDVYAEDSDNYVWETDGYTGTNGNYCVAALAGNVSVAVDRNSALTNYVISEGQILTLSTGQAANANFSAILTTNHISGNVKFNEQGLASVWVEASTMINGVYYSAGMDTDNNGNYALNVPNGSWYIGAQTCGGGDSLDNVLGSGNYVPPLYQTANIANNNATINFVVLQPTSQITGSVKDSNNNPIAGVGVYADATIGGEAYEAWTGTDNNGNYSLGVANGNWTVNVLSDGNSPCGYYNSLQNTLGYGNYIPPASQPVTINNNGGTANFVVQLCSGVQILTTSLPDGQVNVYYDQYLSASDCTDVYNWLVNDPQDFPPGLHFGSNGEIYGYPTSAGTYNFSVHVDDGNSHSANQNLSIYIAPASSPLQITTFTLPYGTNGIFFSQTLQASGGQPPYSWSMPVYSASLPPNLTLATNGLLSGTPSATTGSYPFDVVVTDAANNTSEEDGLTLYIVNPPPPPLVITNVSLPNGTDGLSYSAQLGATGGQPPYSWSVAGGSANPPPGLTLYSNGLISGTPTTNQAAPYYFKVQVTDANYTTTNKVFSIVIGANSPLYIAGCHFAGTNLVINVTNGIAGTTYQLLASTNLALSVNQWTSVATNTPATNGNFSMTATNVYAPKGPKFFILQAN